MSHLADSLGNGNVTYTDVVESMGFEILACRSFGTTDGDWIFTLRDGAVMGS